MATSFSIIRRLSISISSRVSADQCNPRWFRLCGRRHSPAGQPPYPGTESVSVSAARALCKLLHAAGANNKSPVDYADGIAHLLHFLQNVARENTVRPCVCARWSEGRGTPWARGSSPFVGRPESHLGVMEQGLRQPSLCLYRASSSWIYPLYASAFRPFAQPVNRSFGAPQARAWIKDCHSPKDGRTYPGFPQPADMLHGVFKSFFNIISQYRDSPVNRKQPENHFNGGGFSGPVWSEKAEHLPP